MDPLGKEFRRLFVALHYKETLRTPRADETLAEIHEATLERRDDGSETFQQLIKVLAGCHHVAPVTDLCVSCRVTTCAQCVCSICGRGVCQDCSCQTTDGRLFCRRCALAIAEEQSQAELQVMWTTVLGSMGLANE